MPTDVDALLAYGYDLGGPGRWQLLGDDADVSWWDQLNETFEEAAMVKIGGAKKLMPWLDVTGIEIVWYGSDTRHSVSKGYILSAHTYHTYFSQTLPLHQADISSDGRLAQRLGWALDALAIQPLTAGPRWILAASHGI